MIRLGSKPKVMARWPNFFIVGAPRCGTTSLYHYLGDHPDIYMSSVKEPHFFDSDELLAPREQRFRDEKKYLSLFKGAGDKPVVGEATPTYLFDRGAAERIRERVPEAKIIIMLRDPIERAYSQYALVVSFGREQRPFDEAVKDRFGNPSNDPTKFRPMYVARGLYYEQVKRYLGLFGQENVRIYLLEDMASDPTGMLKDVCDFLGVPFYEGSFFDPSVKFNYATPRTAMWHRSIGRPVRILARRLLPAPLRFAINKRVARVLAVTTEAPKPSARPFIGAETRAFLHSVFDDDIRKLQELIGRDLSHWLK